MYLQRHTVSRQEPSLKHLNIEMLRYGHSVSFRSKDFDFENIGCLDSKHCHFLWSYFPHYSPRYTSAHLSSSACCSTQDWQYAPHHERSYGCLCPFRILRSAECKLQDMHFCIITGHCVPLCSSRIRRHTAKVVRAVELAPSHPVGGPGFSCAAKAGTHGGKLGKLGLTTYLSRRGVGSE